MRRALLVLALLGMPRAVVAQEGDVGDEERDSAWKRSVAAEVAGDLPRAEAILTRAFGKEGGNYFVRLRRAYLALLQGRFAQAEARYAALQATEEGASDPDVAAGLKAARTGTLPSAGADVQARVVPEVWGAMVGQSLGTSNYLGGAVFAHLPVRITPEIQLHGAARYVGYQRQGGGSRWAFGQTGPRQFSLVDGFVGADYERPGWGLRALGAYEKISDANALGGGSLRARVGERYGIVADGTVLESAGSATNWQAAPQVFFWPSPSIGLRAGSRLTFDDRRSASVLAGASLYLGEHSLHVDGHLGNERAALNPASFSLLNLPGDATLGGTLTLAVRLSPTFRLLAQAQGEHLKNDGAEGAYWSAALGIDMAFGSL